MLVCLDVDGCLIDSDRPMITALNGALSALGLPTVSLDDVRPHLGPPLVTTLSRLLAAIGAETDQAPTVAQRYREIYATTSVDEAATYPGIDQCLHALLAAEHRLVVVSSKPARYSEPVIDAVGYRGRFAGIYRPEGAELEPKAETLARALGDNPGLTAVMVGDTVQDVEAAHATNSHSIAVSWGYGAPADLAAANPDALIRSPEELPAAVASMRAQ